MIPVIEAKGARIPGMGLGTMTLKDQVCVDAVSAALRMGYRNIDTAAFYGNETEVGEGIRRSDIPRDDIFLTTKVPHTALKPGDFEASVERSLKCLGLPCVDLLLVHWPSPELPLADYIPALCRARRNGQTRHIGVANFTIALQDEATKIADEPLVNNQIEVPPFLDQTKLLAHCKRLGISVTAYCPIGRGKIAGVDTLDRIGARYGKSGPQIALRWLVQQRIVPIPRTANPDKMKQNLDVFDFVLTQPEMNEIGGLARPDGRIVNPPQAPNWDR